MKRLHVLLLTALLSIFGVIAGCGEVEETGNDQNNANQQNDVDEGSYGAIWTEMDGDYGCAGAGCHGDMVPSLGEAEDVVGVESECDGTVLVEPGEPEESLLWQKVAPQVDGDDVCGDKMPPAEPEGIDQGLADQLYDWIADGAEH